MSESKSKVLSDRDYSTVKVAVYQPKNYSGTDKLTLFESDSNDEDYSYVPPKTIQLTSEEITYLYIFLREVMKEREKTR